MRKRLIVLLDAALFIVATCIVFVPELRGPAMRAALFTLFTASAVVTFRRLYTSGMLGLTPKGILHSPDRPRFSLLTGAAAIMGAIAVTIL